MAAPATIRNQRERELVEATRALFDERGMQDAPIEEIARAVGINKALIYRVFASKEELFVLTVTHYLEELRAVALAPAEAGEPEARLRVACDRFTRFCLRYPAFLDCALSLMRRPAAELRERVSEGVWLRLGRSMAACLAPLAAILADGKRRGAFAIEDPDFTANRLYTQVLGTMHLARVGAGVREAAPGVPDVFVLAPEQVRLACIDDALALARITRAPSVT
ncbi:MAG: TetR/AcrR family transcriptional regulator [Solirubrobacteraceae bacterium]